MAVNDFNRPDGELGWSSPVWLLGSDDTKEKRKGRLLSAPAVVNTKTPKDATSRLSSSTTRSEKERERKGVPPEGRSNARILDLPIPGRQKEKKKKGKGGGRCAARSSSKTASPDVLPLSNQGKKRKKKSQSGSSLPPCYVRKGRGAEARRPVAVCSAGGERGGGGKKGRRKPVRGVSFFSPSCNFLPQP